jgi:predicted membrane chloride channel (bestrophin family)
MIALKLLQRSVHTNLGPAMCFIDVDFATTMASQVPVSSRSAAGLPIAAATALLQFLQMNDTINKGSADRCTCGRIFFYAMPYSITLSCSGVLEIWLLLMPLATVVDSPPAGMPGGASCNSVPAIWVDLLLYVLACVLMLGLGDVAVQLEQPFAHIPLMDMADATLRAVAR